MPFLRDHPEDIPVLAKEFIRRTADSLGLNPPELSDESLATLQTYDWPGNVRELRNVIERLLIMGPGQDGEVIRSDMLPGEIGATAPASLGWEKGSELMALELREAREVFEREYLLAQVTRFGGNISRTAEFVGMERSALHRKLKTLGIQNENRQRRAED